MLRISRLLVEGISMQHLYRQKASRSNSIGYGEVRLIVEEHSREAMSVDLLVHGGSNGMCHASGI
jgi:hypothetical protein